MEITRVILQSITLGIALYFSTTMVHNWVMINSHMEVKFAPGTTVYRNLTGRLASLFWALFFLISNL